MQLPASYKDKQNWQCWAYYWGFVKPPKGQYGARGEVRHLKLALRYFSMNYIKYPKCCYFLTQKTVVTGRNYDIFALEQVHKNLLWRERGVASLFLFRPLWSLLRLSTWMLISSMDAYPLCQAPSLLMTETIVQWQGLLAAIIQQQAGPELVT